MYICEACREEVDPESPDVVSLMHWIPTRSFGDDVDRRIEGPGEYFHKRHPPRIGLEYRPRSSSSAKS